MTTIKREDHKRDGFRSMTELTLQWGGHCNVPRALMGFWSIWRPQRNFEAQLLQSNERWKRLQCYVMRAWHAASLLGINSSILHIRLSLYMNCRKGAWIRLRWYTSLMLLCKWYENRKTADFQGITVLLLSICSHMSCSTAVLANTNKIATASWKYIIMFQK